VQLRSTGSLLNEQRNCRYFWTRPGGTAADRPCRAAPLRPPLDTTLDILRFAAALGSGSSDLLQFQAASSGTGQKRSFVLRIGLPIAVIPSLPSGAWLPSRRSSATIRDK
jgi:hypothetical protein